MVLSPENYAFIMNVDTLEVDKFQLAPGHMMRRATSDEIVVIKRHVKQFGGGGYPLGTYLWEERLPRYEGQVKILPESEWRYFCGCISW